jgi:hypothetical protein
MMASQTMPTQMPWAWHPAKEAIVSTDNDEIMLEANERILTALEAHSGPIVRELAQSKEATYGKLTDHDARNRFAALSLLHLIWGITQEIVDTCEDLASCDPGAKVRGAAVLCLSKYYRNTNNVRIKKLLASITIDAKEAADVREVAYSGLFSLAEPDPLEWPNLGLGFNFPTDVDWAFVNRCLNLRE